MTRNIFAAPWIEAWLRELEESSDYGRAAAEWQGSLLLEMTDPTTESQAAYLDLVAERCRLARPASVADWERADYLIRGRIGWHFSGWYFSACPGPAES